MSGSQEEAREPVEEDAQQEPGENDGHPRENCPDLVGSIAPHLPKAREGCENRDNGISVQVEDYRSKKGVRRIGEKDF